MNQLGDTSNYLDLAGIQQLKAHAGANPDDKEALKQAAEHFESIFINMMLQSMRKANAVFEEGNPMHSNTTKFFRDMYDQQLATDMASKGSLGLSELIVQQLSNSPEDYRSASTLRNDASIERTSFNLGEKSDFTDYAPQTNLNKAPQISEQGLPTGLTAAGGDITKQFTHIIDNAFSQVGLAISKSSTDLPPDTEETETKQVVNFESAEDFVTQIWQDAKRAAKEIGLNPAVMVAQSALETGWGKHIIEDKNGDSSFNLFNVKAHRDWDGDKAAQSTLEFENGLPVRKVEPFRVYNNFSESFGDFIDFLKSNGRYDDALNKTGDSEQFLQGLQDAGYATDPSYADKILGILKSNSFKTMIDDLNGKSNVR
jgi:peptidoglycan hydrolase FlgJ